MDSNDIEREFDAIVSGTEINPAQVFPPQPWSRIRVRKDNPHNADLQAGETLRVRTLVEGAFFAFGGDDTAEPGRDWGFTLDTEGDLWERV